MRRYIVSKWVKTAELLKHNELQTYIPKTVPMNRNSLLDMLHEFQMVYIKPDIGTFGNGVMRVEWDPERSASYQYQLNESLRLFSTYDSMYQELQRKTNNRRYLVQKGIQLLKYRKRRFDMRIMVQKNPYNEWETTGWIGRVAHPKKIVTNYHSGGTLKPIELLLDDYLTQDAKKQYMEKLKKLGVRVAQQLNKRFTGIKEIGIDLAMDERIKPWILEVNTKPDPYIFRFLADKTVFSKVIRYARAHRRG